MIRFLSVIILLGVFSLAEAQNKKLAQPDLPGDLMLDIGFNYWTKDKDTLKNWASKSLGVYYTQRMKISNKLSFYPAAGISFEKYGFVKNYTYADIDGKIAVDTINNLIRKNKLAVTYFDVPLELRFHPKGTIEGEGFFVGAGVYGGLRLTSHTKVKYLVGDDKRKQKVSDDFGLQDYRYGYVFRAGWKGINFFYKRQLSDVYRSKQKLVDPDLEPTGKLYNPTVNTFGINFTGF